jgi:hypothetical protein
MKTEKIMMNKKILPQSHLMKKQIGLALLALAAIGATTAPQIPNLVMPILVTDACLQETPQPDKPFAVETAVPACWLVD